MDETVWQIRVLGELSAECSGKRFRLGPDSREGRLVARLLESPGVPLRRQTLAEELWGERRDPPANLRQALAHLRRFLEPAGISQGSVLTADALRVGLRAGSCRTDRAAFEQALRDREQATGSERERLLREAVMAYGGAFLPGFKRDEWIQDTRARLREQYVETLYALSNLLADSDRLGEALEFARVAARTEPLIEELHRHVMELSLRLGKWEETLWQYGQLQQALQDAGLGLPSLELQQLVQEIAAGEPGEAAAPGALPGLYQTRFLAGTRNSPRLPDGCAMEPLRPW